MHKTDGHLRKSLETQTVPPLPMRHRGEDGNGCKLLGESLVSPAQQSPPSSMYSSRMSSKSGRFSTLSTASTTASSNESGRSYSKRRKNSSGDQTFTAHSASRDLRSLSLSRNRRCLYEPETFHSPPVLTMEELMLDLQGGNGRQKKQEAEEKVRRRAWLQAEKDLQAQHDEELRCQQQKEQDEWLRRAMADQEEVVQKNAEHARLEEEKEEKQRAMDDEARLQMEANEAKLKRLQQPRQCITCGGSGKCSACSGSGCHTVTYLSSNVGAFSQAFRGRTESGCRACGGRQDGAEPWQSLDIL